MKEPSRVRGGAPARLALAALSGLILLLAACAPRLGPPEGGTAAAEPQIAEDRLIMADGAALPLRRWLPSDGCTPCATAVGSEAPEAVILALHGFNDYSNAFAEAASDWAELGIATYAYDQRGFGANPHAGLWAGESRLIEDLRSAAALLRARYPEAPLYLLGESMGGAVVMAAMASAEPPEADGIILVAPAAWGRELQGPLQTTLLWLAAHTMPWLTLTGKGLDIWPSDNIEMLRALGRDPLVIKETRVDAIYGLVNIMDRALEAAPEIHGPALVLYGSHEEVIPPKAALAMLRRLPPNPPAEHKVAIYPDGYHMLLRDLQAEVVRRDIAAWIADRDAPLPSGADRVAAAVLSGDGDGLMLAEDVARALMTGGAATAGAGIPASGGAGTEDAGSQSARSGHGESEGREAPAAAEEKAPPPEAAGGWWTAR
jgi:alpha-beta hydrolase superfamily lysophospholipase